MPEATTVHWHGLALRNDMDGVPGLTMPAVESGEAFEYSFAVYDPGTYRSTHMPASSSTTACRPR